MALAAGGVVFGLGIAVGLGLPNGLESRARHLANRNVALESQNQSLVQQQQTATAAAATLKQALASRDTELQKLKQEQAFYAKLIGVDGGRSGLGVHGIVLTQVAHTNAWNFTVTLVNTAENADVARGALSVAVEGVADGKLVTLNWASLTGAASRQGIPFAFKFFQQLQGSLALPKGFVPNRVTVTLQPTDAPVVTRTLDWSAALAGQRGGTVGTP